MVALFGVLSAYSCPGLTPIGLGFHGFSFGMMFGMYFGEIASSMVTPWSADPARQSKAVLFTKRG
jgi:hypothetical protein